MSRKSVSRNSLTPRSNPHFGQTKSQSVVQQQQIVEGHPIKHKWYQQLCLNKTNMQLPSYIPTIKHTQPYKFTITKIHNISFPKKSSQSHQFIKIQAFFITDRLQAVGKQVIFQCQQAIIEGKQEFPIVFYYHSRVNRNFNHLKMVLNFNLIEYKNGSIESVIKLGTSLIDEPFIEKQMKSTVIFKDCSEVDLISNYSQVSLQMASTNFSYKIQSYNNFKLLIKVVPSQYIVSTSDHIGGIYNGYLPNQEENEQIEEGNLILLKISYLHIDIVEEFEKQIQNAIKKIPEFSQFVSPKITSRKLIFGFHNQHQFVTPTQRKLQLQQKQGTGKYTVIHYEVISENEIVKVPFYVDEERSTLPTSVLAASLIYEINGIEVETAIFAIDPKTNGESQDLSVDMIIGPGIGIKGSLLNLGSVRKPTILMEYNSEEIMTGRSGEDDIRTFSRKRLKSNYRIPLKTSKQITEHEIRENQKVLEEVEVEKLQLLKERQYIQEMQTQNFINFQQQFQKRLQEEKEELWKRQNMLQYQYRQEVQKEIAKKIQMQKQIWHMKQKIAMLQERQKDEYYGSKKLSYNHSPSGMQEQFVQTGIFPPQDHHHLKNMKNHHPHHQQERRQMLVEDDESNYTDQIKQFPLINPRKQEDIENQYKQFNHASKFTFTFTSIVWISNTWPPKSFFFLIKFFNFHDYKTDVLSCIEGDNQYQQLVKHNFQEKIQGEKEPIYIFTVDPSRSRNPKINHQDLVNYLVNDHVIVQVLTQNFLQVGTIKIPMYDLLRGSKSQVLVAKQAKIIRDKQLMGTVQILIKNQKEACFGISNEADHKKVKTEIKKKVISNPINIPVNIPKENEGQSYQKKKILSRQEQRIQNFKRQTALKANSFNEQKIPSINRINQYKQRKMPEVISRISKQK